jgi:serine/threonine protein kinase
VPDDLIGVTLDGRYEIKERIAAGAMGVVYRGERVKLGRAVAIKFLHASLADDPSRRQRFEIEAIAMAKLDHPHCATVIDVGVHAQMPYVVMDFIKGTTLRDVLDDGRIDPQRALVLMRQILAGLAHAHEFGIVHRDVKPANVMLSQRGLLGEQARILDFGLARLREGNAGLTAGMIVGTPAYMSPEQCKGGVIDARADVYACGILLFEMLTGRKPFEHDEPIEILRMQIHTTPPRLADVAPELAHPGLEAVVARALAKLPDERYPSAAELSAALDAAVNWAGVTVINPQQAPLPRPRLQLPQLPPGVQRHHLIAGGVVGAILLIGVFARCAG